MENRHWYLIETSRRPNTDYQCIFRLVYYLGELCFVLTGVSSSQLSHAHHPSPPTAHTTELYPAILRFFGYKGVRIDRVSPALDVW